MKHRAFLLLFMINTLTALVPVAKAQQGEHNFNKWEKEIAAFEEKDRTQPPPKRAVLFIGSSTIRLWKTLAEDFPEYRIINRGFGGSEIMDATYFADRIVFPYEPRMIFLRAGGNDIHNGKSPEQVFSDFKEFFAKVRTKLPEAEIVFISLSPSPARWSEAEKNKELNALIKDYAQQVPRLKYIETYDLPLNADGQPRPELFIEDKLHFNAEGYRLLAERVRPFLPKRITSPEVHPDHRVTFRLKAPNARQVLLSCETIKPVPMQRDLQGVWSATVGPFEPDYYVYSYLVDGLRVIDPSNPLLKYNLLSTENQLHVPGPETLPWEISQVPHGVIHRHFFKSNIIGDERTYLVYTPPNYNPAAKVTYPVLYLLHGYSDAEDTWTTVGKANVILDNLIAQSKAKPKMVVMPFGYGNKELIALGWELIRGPEADQPWEDSFTKFRNSLFEELIPQVEKNYHVASDPAHRAVAGLSMGGSQSLFIGLNALDRFAWIGAFSSGGLKPDFGAQFPKAASEQSKSQLRLLWIGCGKDDRLIEINQKFVNWLETKDIPHTWVERPGGHSFLVWRRFLAEFAPLLFQDVPQAK